MPLGHRLLISLVAAVAAFATPVWATEAPTTRVQAAVGLATDLNVKPETRRAAGPASVKVSALQSRRNGQWAPTAYDGFLVLGVGF
jgi:hypothetical protein